MKLIDGYGLFWDRSGVDWGGGQGKPRKILGARNRTSTSERVNFNSVAAIYALYSSSFELVYIGQTGRGDSRLGKRLADHRTDHLSNRWARFSWFRIDESEEDIPYATILNHMEALAISIAEPRLNLQKGRWGDSVEQFFQADE